MFTLGVPLSNIVQRPRIDPGALGGVRHREYIIMFHPLRTASAKFRKFPSVGLPFYYPLVANETHRGCPVLDGSTRFPTKKKNECHISLRRRDTSIRFPFRGASV